MTVFWNEDTGVLKTPINPVDSRERKKSCAQKFLKFWIQGNPCNTSWFTPWITEQRQTNHNLFAAFLRDTQTLVFNLLNNLLMCLQCFIMFMLTCATAGFSFRRRLQTPRRTGFYFVHNSTFSVNIHSKLQMEPLALNDFWTISCKELCILKRVCVTWDEHEKLIILCKSQSWGAG